MQSQRKKGGPETDRTMTVAARFFAAANPAWEPLVTVAWNETRRHQAGNICLRSVAVP